VNAGRFPQSRAAIRIVLNRRAAPDKLRARNDFAAMTHKLDLMEGDAAGGLAGIFLGMRGELLRFLAARRVAADEAEDLLQDLFLKIGGRTPGPVGQPRAYLYRMLDNLLLDRRRSAARRSARERSWSEIRGGAEAELDDAPSPERRLIARERLASVSRAMDGLPERTVLILRRFRLDQIPQHRIAAEIGISVSAVEKHLQRAYRAILAADRSLDAESGGARRPLHEEGLE
jgi:RNA polymerase sigma factor (sigma-70 family)